MEMTLHRAEGEGGVLARLSVIAAGKVQSPDFHQLDRHDGRSHLLWNGRADGLCAILPMKGIGLPVTSPYVSEWAVKRDDGRALIYVINDTFLQKSHVQTACSACSAVMEKAAWQLVWHWWQVNLVQLMMAQYYCRAGNTSNLNRVKTVRSGFCWTPSSRVIWFSGWFGWGEVG